MEMSLPVTLAVLGVALLHALWNVLVKATPDEQLGTVSVLAGASLFAAALIPWLPTAAP